MHHYLIIKSCIPVTTRYYQYTDTNDIPPISHSNFIKKMSSLGGSNYFVRILSTLNRELLKPNCSVALHRHSHAVVDILPPEADSTAPWRLGGELGQSFGEHLFFFFCGGGLYTRIYVYIYTHTYVCVYIYILDEGKWHFDNENVDLDIF